MKWVSHTENFASAPIVWTKQNDNGNACTRVWRPANRRVRDSGSLVVKIIQPKD